MKFLGALLPVENMHATAVFYEELLGEATLFDFDANRQYESGVSLQTRASFRDVLHFPREPKPGEGMMLCYETEEFERFLNKLQDGSCSVRMVEGHSQPGQYEWGQRYVRLYDPDNRIVEICESMRDVICRFSAQGLTVEDIVMSTGMPAQSVKEYLGIL